MLSRNALGIGRIRLLARSHVRACCITHRQAHAQRSRVVRRKALSRQLCASCSLSPLAVSWTLTGSAIYCLPFFLLVRALPRFHRGPWLLR